MKIIVLIAVISVLIIKPVSECFGQNRFPTLYSIKDLTEEQKNYMVRENKLLNISIGLTLIGCGLMDYSTQTDNDSIPIYPALLGACGLAFFKNPLLDNKRNMGILVYNKHSETAYVARTLNLQIKLVTAVYIWFIGYVVYDETSYYTSRNSDDIYRYSGLAITFLAGLIELIDGFSPMPSSNNGNFNSEETGKTVDIGFDIKKDYLGIRMARAF